MQSQIKKRQFYVSFDLKTPICYKLIHIKTLGKITYGFIVTTEYTHKVRNIQIFVYHIYKVACFYSNQHSYP